MGNRLYEDVGKSRRLETEREWKTKAINPRLFPGSEKDIAKKLDFNPRLGKGSEDPNSSLSPDVPVAVSSVRVDICALAQKYKSAFVGDSFFLSPNSITTWSSHM